MKIFLAAVMPEPARSFFAYSQLFCNSGRFFLLEGNEDKYSDMTASNILSQKDEAIGCAVEAGLNRIRSWRAPPNWSRRDWIEELAAVGTAAACQAVCEFDPARGVPLVAFGYCRMISRCLARYRKEWRYARDLTASDSCGEELITNNSTDWVCATSAKIDETNLSNHDLCDAIGALPAEQRWLIQQLFWEERTEREIADRLGTNQSTISRRKDAILSRLRKKLSDVNEFQRISA